jgi:hypothetical protein
VMVGEWADAGVVCESVEVKCVKTINRLDAAAEAGQEEVFFHILDTCIVTSFSHVDSSCRFVTSFSHVVSLWRFVISFLLYIFQCLFLRLFRRVVL